MSKIYSKIIIFVFLVFFTILGLVIFYKKPTEIPTPTPTPTFSPYTQQISLGGIDVLVEIVDTPEKMAKGLSGRSDLKNDQGMLFVYEKPQYVTFWMPDMNFDIDIIFLRNNKVVQIVANVPKPEPGTAKTELPRYPSNQAVDMVLEVPAGWAEQESVVIGTELKFE